MFVEGKDREDYNIAMPSESILNVQERSNYNGGKYLQVIVKDAKLFPNESRNETWFQEYEIVELSDDYEAFMFKLRIAKGLSNDQTKEHKEA